MQRLTPAMVGEDADHQLGSWGAETNGLLLFTQYLLQRFAEKVTSPTVAGNLTKAVSSMVGVHLLIKEYQKGVMPTKQIQEFVDHWKRHIQAMKALGATLKPKHHQMAHMCVKLLTGGTPHLWGTWVEESENHPIAKLGLRSHRSVWPWRVLGDHWRAFGARAPKATIGKRRKTGL